MGTFEDYIISNQPDQRKIDPVARVTPPFSTGDPDGKREATTRDGANQKVAFVVTTSATHWTSRYGARHEGRGTEQGWFPSEKVESFKGIYASLPRTSFWLNQIPRSCLSTMTLLTMN